MAYIKYKELTKYFNFEREINPSDLPKYVTDYVDDREKILMGYKNSRDYAIFTDQRIILFDKTPMTTLKKIHVIPYKSISTSAISYGLSKVEIFLSLDSGYPLKLTFIKMDDSKKVNLKNIYIKMVEPR